ncbi:MAG: protein phosphatase 2C domain-containing protein [Moraxellaceae bacterium]|nr:protein phosphatase 2C domain-containing protein [Moraxellaceae bacterium]
MITWTSAFATDVGNKRKINEDALLNRPEVGLWVVADGMGGHAAGDVASNAVVHPLSVMERPEALADFVEAVETALMSVNQQLRSYAIDQLEGRTVGSTVVSMVLSPQTGVCLWAGDSRLYRLRNGQLSRLSRDHSAVQEMVEAGAITQDEADHHPKSNVITRAVGAGEFLFIDSAVFAPMPGDTYLLCSDGLYNEVAEDSIRRKLGLAAEEAVSRLIDEALCNGGRDNVSVIVVKVQGAA